MINALHLLWILPAWSALLLVVLAILTMGEDDHV